AAEETVVDGLRHALTARERAIFEVERQAQEVANLVKLHESQLDFLAKESAAVTRRREEQGTEVERIEAQIAALDSEDADLSSAAAECISQKDALADELLQKERTRAALAEERDRAHHM